MAEGLRRVPRRADLRCWVEAATAAAGAAGTVAMRVMGLEEMQALNARFRGRDKPTNVLSFPADATPTRGARALGDLALCAPVIEREAAEQGKTPAEHWAHMVVHGVLHLLGYDHETASDARVMEAQEVAVLARLGVTDPYRARTMSKP